MGGKSMLFWIMIIVGFLAFCYGIGEFFFTKTFQTKNANILPEDRFGYTKQGGIFNIIGGIVILVCTIMSQYGKYQNILIWICLIYFACTAFRDKPYYQRKKKKGM